MHHNLIAAIGVLSMLSIPTFAYPSTEKTTAKGPVKSSKVKSSRGKNNIDKENKASVTLKNPENSKKGPVKSSKVKSSKGKNNVDKENKVSVTPKNPENSASSIPAYSDQENTDFVPPAEAVSAGVFDFEKIHDYKIDYGQHKGKVAPIYGLRVRIPGKNVKIEKFKKKFAMSNQKLNALNNLPEKDKEKKIAEWCKWFRKEMPKDKALVHTICDAHFKPYDCEYGFFDPECYDSYLSENDFLLGFYIPGEDSNKDPIILVHGGPRGDGEGMLEDIGVELSKTTGRSVLAYTQRGCRGSGLAFDPGKDSFQQSAQDLDKVIDATLALSGKKRVVLCGHSFGTTLVNEYLGTMDKGKVSSYIAAGPAETDLTSFARTFVKRKASHLINSSLIKNLELENSLRLEKMKTEEALDEVKLQQKLDNSVEKKLIENLSKTYFSNFDKAKDYYKREKSEELLLLQDKTECYACKIGYPETDNSILIDFYKRLKDPKGQEMLKNIRVPTLIIAGEHDSLDPKSAKITADKIRNSELHVMKDAAHWMFHEKPEEFYPLVKNFLDRVDAGKKIGTGKIKDLESMGKKVRIPQDKNVPAA